MTFFHDCVVVAAVWLAVDLLVVGWLLLAALVAGRRA